METKRDSKFELLRIFCYFGIVLLHVYGNFMPNAIGSVRFCGIIINCLFNTGVSIFILISGYYGIRLVSREKVISFWLCLLFYSLLGEVLVQCGNDEFNFRSIIISCFPVFSRRWWYMSTYFLLMLFSPWINRIVDVLSEKEFLKMLAAFLIVFSIIPSCIGWTIFADGGKGIGNLLFVYLLGQYLKKYSGKYKVRRKYCIVVGLIVFCTMLLLTTVKTILKREIGIEGPFFRDASIFTVILSICIFLFFQKCKISSKGINFIAKRGIGIYLMDYTIRTVLLERIIIPQTIVGIGYCIFIVLLIMFIGIVVESFRRSVVCNMDKYIVRLVNFLMNKIIIILNNGTKILKEKSRC